MSTNDENKEIQETTENEAEKIMNLIMSEVVVTFILWILVIGIIIYTGLGFFKKNDSIQQLSMFAKSADFFVLLVLLFSILNSYYLLTSDQRNEFFTFLSQALKDDLNDNYSMLYTLMYIVIIYGLSYLFKMPTEIDKMPRTISLVTSFLIVYFILLVIVFVFNNFINIRVVDMLYEAIGSLFNKKVENDDEENEAEETQETGKQEEVYNVSNNLYTYEEAPYVCQALNGRLATYDEVEQSYVNGAEWCNYGWSQDQLALFPTQKETWNKLKGSVNECDKKGASIQNMCGRPGVNGGYIANPNIKFGVNCYGVKPEPKDYEKNMMDANKNKVLPKSGHQLAIDRKTQFWKENADKLLTINSYNKDKWSRY